MYRPEPENNRKRNTNRISAHPREDRPRAHLQSIGQIKPPGAFLQAAYRHKVTAIARSDQSLLEIGSRPRRAGTLR